jgi:isocitrate/isopropylmalate dehydrogenase
MKLKIAVLAGDGIGPEVTREATNILRAVAELGGHDFTFVEGLIGGIAITETPSRQTSVPRLASCRSVKLLAASPICDPPSPTLRSPKAHPFVLKSLKTLTFSSSANSSAGFTSAHRAGGTKKPTKPSTPCVTPSPRWSA